jgi:hypothetical protein
MFPSHFSVIFARRWAEKRWVGLLFSFLGSLKNVEQMDLKAQQKDRDI